jgi:hypothetical protein
MAQTAYRDSYDLIMKNLNLIIFKVLDGVDNEDYWVYGTDLGSPGKFFWCSNEREFEPKEIAWAPGEPNNKYHCVYLKNLGVNKTVLATADCETEKKFLCDVRKKGAGGPAMQQECLEIWGITTSGEN